MASDMFGETIGIAGFRFDRFVGATIWFAFADDMVGLLMKYFGLVFISFVDVCDSCAIRCNGNATSSRKEIEIVFIGLLCERGFARN